MKGMKLKNATQIEKETYAEQEMTLEAFTSYYGLSLDMISSPDENNKEKSDSIKSSRIFYKVKLNPIVFKQS